MRTILKWVFSVLKFFRSQIFSVGVLAALLSVTVYAASTNINTVYIHDELLEEPLLIHTAERNIQTILKNEGIVTEKADLVETRGVDGGVAEVYITRAFDVEIEADGKTKTVPMTGGTVRDALKQAGLAIDDDDIINVPAAAFVEDGTEIVINRVDYRTTEVVEEIPFEQQEKYTPLLRPGRREILQSGRNGKRVKTYVERTIDGVVEESQIDGENITVRPVTQVSLVGAKVPVSDLDFGASFTGAAPTQYTKVIENARATGYSAGNGAWGASGNDLFYGHVAVNPEVIPYNSKLYITSPDGSFVYGYAIASDTGVALMQGVIDVDLYYETYRESQLNGVKWVNIYVLE